MLLASSIGGFRAELVSEELICRWVGLALLVVFYFSLISSLVLLNVKTHDIHMHLNVDYMYTIVFLYVVNVI